MIAPRWKKAWRDVAAHPGRSLLAMVAMAAGVFEIGAMLYPDAILAPELRSFYGRTHPASATILTDAVNDALVDTVRNVPGVGDAEARPLIEARTRRNAGEWTPAAIFVVRDFDHPRLDTFVPDRGAPRPAPGDVLLERTALRVAHVTIGDSLTFRLPDGSERRLRVAGTVHAAGLPPAWMEHMVPGFVAWNSVLRSAPGESEQIRIAVRAHALEEGHIREVADSVRARLERAGHPVARVTVPPPGRHPHADQMAGFLYLLLAFGLLSFALGTVLVAAMLQTLMAEQVREIGVMHAVGATTGQIAGVYLAEVALLALGALVLGVPSGLAVGGAYARFSADLLNVDLTSRAFPAWVLVLEIVAGLAVPLLVALGPVRRAARLGVQAALTDVASPSARRAPAALRVLTALPRPQALPLRTLLERPGRLALTVLMLGLGGATFMGALDVADAWRASVERDFAGRRFDLTASLADPEPVAAVKSALLAIPDVAHVECWPGASGYVVGASGVPGGAVGLAGPDPGSVLLAPRMLAGRWLAGDDSGVAVVNRAAQRLDPRVAPGRDITLRIEDRDVRFRVVGVSGELMPMPLVYAPGPAVLAATRDAGDLTRIAHVVLRRRGVEAERRAEPRVERALAAAGFEVTGLQRLGDAKQALLDHLVIIFSILMLAAALVVFVAGLAFASTLTLGVIRRTREIGVLAAIGATPRVIAGQIALESLVIAGLGWLAGVVLAIPLSALLENATGNIFFKMPLPFSVSPSAAIAWLGVVLLLAVLAGLQPVSRATRLTIREALAHV